jgi:hypothetical protein
MAALGLTCRAEAVLTDSDLACSIVAKYMCSNGPSGGDGCEDERRELG